MSSKELVHQPAIPARNIHPSNEWQAFSHSALDRSLIACFEQVAARYPDRPAICAINQPALTHNALYQQIATTAARLNELGIGRHDRVAIVLPNGPVMAVTFLAVAACATSAPLNPGYRAAEFDFYLTDLNAKAVIVDATVESSVRAVARARHIPLIELATSTSMAGCFTLAGQGATLSGPIGFAEADDIALLLHTSGTTARPKLVPLTQRNLLRSATNIGATLALSPADRCLNVMPLFHIHGLVAALLSALVAGGSVVCTPGFAANDFFDWFAAFQPTWYTAVPTIHQAIVARAANQPLIQTSKLRFVRSSSAALPPTVMTALEQIFNTPVIEAYGMTEAAHQMTSNPLPSLPRKPGSVGMPAGPQVAIMAEAGNTLLAPGEIGEVVICGENVMRGYVNQPEANAKAFVDQWFRTGDQGYFDRDGYLFITGRLKEMINRGGEKIAPRDVEEMLLAHPAVAQAITFAVPHATLGEDVAAAVVLAQKSNVTERELRHFLFGRIADYKIPSQIVIIDEIPKGPTGKVQRIGSAERLAQQLHTPFVPPTTMLETSLLQIWREVLQQETVGITHNFFAVGGDSLRAMQVVARIHSYLGIEIQPSLLFASPTIVELGGAILLAKLEQTTPAEMKMLLAELGIDHAEAEKEPEHWSKAAKIYRQIEAPLQPSAEDIATMERFVAMAARWIAPASNPKLNAILLGVTPAIATMAWPPNTSLLAIDRSEGMLHGVWPGDRPGVREARLGDWLALPVDDGACSVVVGDGSFNCLEFPTAYEQLANSVARVLHDDGVLILRVYVQPATPRSREMLFQDLVAGKFTTFDGFKFLLCMDLVDEQWNVAVQDVWQYWSQVKGDEQAILNATGWSAAKFETIAHYQNSAARFSFPTLSEVERIFSPQFERIDIAFPSYPLGECCPTLLLRKRSRGDFSRSASHND